MQGGILTLKILMIFSTQNKNIKMKTLVIHPKDSSTDFLSVIYADKKDWTIITDPKVSNKVIKNQIKSHDRVIFLGHGTQKGLIAMTSANGFRYIIDSSLVYLLKDKECVCIWCNADVFVNKYSLKGFYSGMIISEYEEALHCCLHDFNYSQIVESNILFAKSIAKSIESKNILELVKSSYIVEGSPIVEYNRNNLYLTESSAFN